MVINERRARKKLGSSRVNLSLQLCRIGNKNMPIANAVQQGLIIRVYNENGQQLFALDPGSGPDDGLQGYTRYTVIIRRGNTIYTYNDKGNFLSAVTDSGEKNPLMVIKENMRQQTTDEKTYWTGNHKLQGVVLYDPGTQAGVPGSQVRLFVAKARRMELFSLDVGDILKDPQTEGQETQVIQAVRFYHDLRARARSTHCYRCKKALTSVDFSVCSRCGWIKCVCDACGCGYRGDPDGLSR